MTHTDPPSSVSTPDRLLDAAERLFLEKGADRVSVRAVNAEAGLNPGAVHYHFGSREGLVAALLERELLPVWESRLKSLSPGEGDEPVGVEALVAAVVRPFEELSRTDKGRMLCHLLARESLPTGGMYSNSPWFTASPFEVMLARALPGLSAREVSARWRLAFTLLLEVYGRPLDRSATAAGSAPEAATVIAFLTAGLSAPPPPQEPR
ncbi:TetR/AcrR family transcriptional regulator [Nocardiopsis halotolerans]|uniref:TetR/AcrR family transcriptional regulator n=1 Tax=Nocardiopsis halotolerans TaxID=124252 RepID=UPI0003469E0A|nr:TetR/AcrR family transcriptional regulator [Nocardiopsis halotolerans]